MLHVDGKRLQRGDASIPSLPFTTPAPTWHAITASLSFLVEPFAPDYDLARALATKKGILFSGLALLIIVASLGASLLALKILAKPGPSKKWSFQPEGFLGISFSPIIANGMVYTLFEGIFNNSSLYALDAFSGNQKWSYRLVLQL